jgi:hypothetical protein
MAVHPKKPKDPLNPVKNRHVVRMAEDKHDARGRKQLLLMQTDAIRVLTWLGEAPLRTITGDAMRAWVKSQQPEWTKGYWRAVRLMVQDQLAERMEETSRDTKARLMNVSERLLGECRETVVSGGDLVVDRRAPEYRRWMELKSVDDAWQQYDRRMTDYGEALTRQANGGPFAGTKPTEPRWPRLSDREHSQMTELAKCLPYLTTINHTAALGYLKFQAQLTGLAAEKVQHLHLHKAIEQGGDLSEVPESELRAAIALKVSTTKEQAHAG